MHLVMLHGYLMQGTGSNIYVANIAKAWQKQGHRVSVLCQDPEAGSLPFVEEFIGPEDKLPSTPPQPGTIRVVVPDINNLLPVYVFDRYIGYQVKLIPDMTLDEINSHIEATACSLRKVALQGADRILANHAILGPVIARRALHGLDIPYDVKIHGSAVEYTLVPNPNLMTYAEEGLSGAKKVFVGTRYVRDRVLEVFSSGSEDLRLKEKLRIVPPGMDPSLFNIADDAGKNQRRFIEKIKDKIERNGNGRQHSKIHGSFPKSGAGLHRKLVKLGETYDQRAIDSDLLEKWPYLKQNEPIILYFGKFLAAKGVGELLVTVPKILTMVPEARFIFVGFGTYREHMECMIEALGNGDLNAFLSCAQAGEFVEKIDFEKWFRKLHPEELNRITITGMLDHLELSEILPLASLSIVPSKWPEAFGMVAVEAMAAGVLPLCNYHAGLCDVIDDVEAVSPEMAVIMKLHRNTFIDELPEKVLSALNYLYPAGYQNKTTRHRIARKLRRIAVEKFSWDGIAKRLLQ
jgi:glycosyltransferase involved in cell wall biosynthesis